MSSRGSLGSRGMRCKCCVLVFFCALLESVAFHYDWWTDFDRADFYWSDFECWWTWTNVMDVFQMDGFLWVGFGFVGFPLVDHFSIGRLSIGYISIGRVAIGHRFLLGMLRPVGFD